MVSTPDVRPSECHKYLHHLLVAPVIYCNDVSEKDITKQVGGPIPDPTDAPATFVEDQVGPIELKGLSSDNNSQIGTRCIAVDYKLSIRVAGPTGLPIRVKGVGECLRDIQ